MQHISLYFDKYKKIENSAHEEKEMLCKAIYEATGIVMKNEDVGVTNGVVRIKLTPGQRSYFLERKEDIITKLSSALNQKSQD